MMGGTGGWFSGRNRHGGFVCSEEDGKILFMSQLFKTGELWGIDACSIEKSKLKEFSRMDVPFFPSTFVEEVFASMLTNYLKFATDTLQLQTPVRLVAGATDVLGYCMAVDSEFRGSMVDQHILYKASIDDLNTDPLVMLRPFFTHFWDECGLDRPNMKIVR
jgi:hypothetical protein